MIEALSVKELLEFVQYIAVILGVPFAMYQLWQNGNSAKVAQAEFALEFMRDYSKQEMSESLRLLASCDKYGNDFDKVWLEKLKAKDPLAIKIEKARRHVKFYYKSAYTLYKERLITKKVFRLACDNLGRNILFDYVAPLGVAIAGDDQQVFINEIKDLLGHHKTEIHSIPPLEAELNLKT